MKLMAQVLCFVLGFFALFVECEDTALLIATKIYGIALLYQTFARFNELNDKGEFDKFKKWFTNE